MGVSIEGLKQAALNTIGIESIRHAKINPRDKTWSRLFPYLIDASPYAILLAALAGGRPAIDNFGVVISIFAIKAIFSHNAKSPN